MSTGVLVALVAVALGLALGAWRVATDGRFRPGRAATPPVTPAPTPSTPSTWDAVLAAVPGAEPGSRATLVQFSSAFCAPCRATRRVLADVADTVPGVVHHEVDAEHHLELVRALGVLRTPTTLVLDCEGREVTRAAGAPRKEQVLQAVARA